MSKFSDYHFTSYPSIIRKLIELQGIGLELEYDIYKVEYGQTIRSMQVFIEIQLLKASNGTYTPN